MRIINKKYLLVIFLAGIILTGVIFLKPNHEVKLDNVILKQEVNNKTMAMYVGRDNNYEEYEGNSFPKGYRLNQNKSKCIDNNGAEINNALKEENGSISLTTNKSSYCYLYFDEKENLSNICNGSTMQECVSNENQLSKIKTIENMTNEITSELYRYHGLEVDNYICFGTDDKETCLSNQDKYLYRIIGITEEGKLKLIKNTSIGTMQWNNKSTKEDCGEDGEKCNWENSTIKTYLNADFLTDEEYIPTGWQDKIAEVNWNVGITKSFSDQPYAQKIYEKESNNKTTEASKIGLMYMSDHYYAYDDGKGATNCDDFYCNSWIFYHTAYEWTMTFVGYDSSRKEIATGIVYLDQIGTQPITSVWNVRPVFYLINKIDLKGLGTIDNPYLISN